MYGCSATWSFYLQHCSTCSTCCRGYLRAAVYPALKVRQQCCCFDLMSSQNKHRTGREFICRTHRWAPESSRNLWTTLRQESVPDEGCVLLDCTAGRRHPRQRLRICCKTFPLSSTPRSLSSDRLVLLPERKTVGYYIGERQHRCVRTTTVGEVSHVRISVW